MAKLKKVGVAVWYSLAVVGILDMTVQMLTGQRVRIIYSILAFFLGEPKQ